MMTRRQSFLAYAALLVGVITFASSFTRPTSGQQAAPAPAPVGRYQIAVAGSYGNHVYVIDSVTGKLWSGYRGNQEISWSETNGPPVAK